MDTQDDDGDGIAFLESLAGATPDVAPASDSAEDDTDRAGAAVRLWRGPEDGPAPTRRVVATGRVVPDLARIERDRWPMVLIPLAERDRTDAALGPGLGDGAALDLLSELPPPSSVVAWRAVERGPAVPIPEAKVPRAGRQVNVRIAQEDWEALQRAAHLLGAKPSQLVRILVLNGVRRVLAEHDAVMAAAAARFTSR